METVLCLDNQSIVSEITENSDNIENFDFKFEEIRCKLNNDLTKLNIDLIKEKCKEIGITGISKLKKPELIQLLETEFFKMLTYLNSKTKNELKLICKNYDVKKISTAKKEYIIYQILLYNSNNMIFKITDTLQPVIIQNKTDNQEQLSPIEQLEKQRKEIEVKMQEEIKKKEEAKRLLEEEEKKKKEEDKRLLEEEKKEIRKKKQTIPKNVRNIVWNHYIGEDIIKHKCLCCKKVTISNTSFEVGHVLSEKNGGTHEINNLRPICFACNHSMGTENMIDFVVKFGLYIG